MGDHSVEMCFGTEQGPRSKSNYHPDFKFELRIVVGSQSAPVETPSDLRSANELRGITNALKGSRFSAELQACLHSVGGTSRSYSSDRFRTTARPKLRPIERPSGCKPRGRVRRWLSAELLGIFSRYGANIRVFQLPGEQSGDVGRRAWGREHVSLDLITTELA